MGVQSGRGFWERARWSGKIFGARFDGALARYARRTNCTTDLLTTFALQAGGEGGARLARKAGVPISPDTLLRILHSLTDDDHERGPPVLGVDDGAFSAAPPWPVPPRSTALHTPSPLAPSPKPTPGRR